jgi:transcriptional regulator with XRE-family HTH domain
MFGFSLQKGNIIVAGPGRKPLNLEVDTAWFKDRMKALDLSQRGIAKKINMQHSLLNKTFLGTRMAQHDEIAQLATTLQSTFEEVAFRFGIKPGISEKKLKLTGEITAKGELIPWTKEERLVDVPKNTPPSMVAARVEERSSDQYGWCYFFDPSDTVLPTAIDSLSVCYLKNGSVLIRFLDNKTDTWGCYNLVDFDKKTESNVQVVAATPVLWIKPR